MVVSPLHCLVLILAVWITAFRSPRGAQVDGPDRWGTLATTVFSTHSQDDGLPAPVVTAMTEDRDGFSWVST